MLYSPAIESIAYANIKNNMYYKNQKELLMPKTDKLGYGNILFLLSPNRESSMHVINSKFIPFQRFQIKRYTTTTKFNTKIGKTRIVKNEIATTKEWFNKNNESSLIFKTDIMLEEEISMKRSFVYDLGTWNELFFKYRYNRNIQMMCRQYIDFLVEKLNTVNHEGYNKILYFSYSEWRKCGANIGMTKDCLNNPLSIIMTCMFRFNALLEPLTKLNLDLLICNEDNKEFIKFPITEELLDPANAKRVFSRFKAQLKKMNVFRYVEESDNTSKATTSTKNEAPNTTNVKVEKVDSYSKAKRQSIVDDMVKRFTGEPVNIFTVDNDTVASNDEDSEDNSEVEVEREEIDDIVNNFLDENPELDDMDESELMDIVEDEIKKNVYINRFMPERSAETLKLIEVASAKQDKILSQDIDDLKSKVIDESDFSNVVHSTNEHIKTSRYVNFDKDYVEKKYKKDINAAVASLSNADTKMFIESVTEEDTSDVFNQKKTLTYVLRDEYNKTHTLKFDVPIIIDDCYVYIGGGKKHILKQRIFKPIVKIGGDQVQICTMYNKVTVFRYGKSVDAKIVAIQRYLAKNNEKFRVSFGNAKVKNAHYKTDLDYDYLSKSMTKFNINGSHFILDIEELLSTLEEDGADTSMYRDGTKIPLGYVIRSGKKVPIDIDDNVSDTILAAFTPEDRSKIKIAKSNTRFAYARAKILDKFIPVALFLLFCEGFTSVMQKCEIPYELFDSESEIIKKYGRDYSLQYGIIKTSDKLIVWPKYPYENQLLLNGIYGLPISEYTFEELDSKDTYIDMLTLFYKSANQAYNLDQFKIFLIDPKTEEILRDFNMPTDLVGVFFHTCKLLVNNQYASTNDLINTRIRGNEIVSQIVYQYIAQAYNKYRKSAYKKRGNSLSVNQNAILQAVANSSLCENESIMNPVATLEKTRAVTIKGSTSSKGITLSGFNKTDNYSMAKRAYDESMLGIFGVTTPADPNNGIIRQLSLEPNITSTNGYVDITPHDQIDELNPAQLFTPAELLTPPGIRHDDPQRSAMMKGQTTHMVLTDDASPVLMGNKVESVVAYHLHNEFCFVAKQDGKVVDIQDGVYVIEYKDGTHDSFDTKPVIRNNPSDGMYTEIQFKTDLELGSKFKKNEVIATEPRAFTKDQDELTASMNIGVLAKVAIVSIDDILEDSEPMTKKLSERLGYWAIVRKSISLTNTTKIGQMAKIGDHVNIGDILIKYDKYSDDDEEIKLINEISKNMSSDELNEFIDSTSTTMKATDSGEIIDIKIYCTVELDELSPTLRKVVSDYYKRIKRNDTYLEKYKNEGDNKFRKCGQLLTESPEKTIASYGKIKNEYVGDGVLIEFYIRHKDIIKKGDKSTNYCALKGVVSNVIPEGQEPWSEFRPEEDVDAFISPLSILARKTPSMYITLFGNKVIIELKRRLVKDYFKGSGDIPTKRKRFMQILIGTFDILDPSKANSKKYKNKFEPMSDAEFNKWVKKFADNEKMYMYWETVEYETDAKLENIEKAAKFLNIPLYEHVVIRHVNDNADGDTIVTPTPCPVGYTHIKRMPQSVHHKNAGSTSIDARSQLTGQVTGRDKNGRTTDVETYALTTYGAERSLKELLGFRADDESAKAQAMASIQTDGYVMQDDIISFQTDKVAINTLDAYYTAMGFKTNIVYGGDAISSIPKTTGNDVSF